MTNNFTMARRAFMAYVSLMNALFYSLFIFLVFSVSNASAGTCADVDADTSPCTFYCQKNQELRCADDSYLSQFGYRYCRLFIEKESSFSDKGKFILSKIRACLIERVAADTDLTCNNAKDLAHKSHIHCYVKNGFCDLGLVDRLTLLRFVRTELVDPVFRNATREILRHCQKGR